MSVVRMRGWQMDYGHLGREDPRGRLWKHGGILGGNTLAWRDMG